MPINNLHHSSNLPSNSQSSSSPSSNSLSNSNQCNNLSNLNNLNNQEEAEKDPVEAAAVAQEEGEVDKDQD